MLAWLLHTTFFELENKCRTKWHLHDSSYGACVYKQEWKYFKFLLLSPFFVAGWEPIGGVADNEALVTAERKYLKGCGSWQFVAR